MHKGMSQLKFCLYSRKEIVLLLQFLIYVLDKTPLNNMIIADKKYIN